MKNFDKSRVHFIGIGGISMSALALEIKKCGAVVSGSDIALSHITERLQAAGIKIYEGHAAANISGAGVVVKNSAIKEGNPELMAARASGAEIIERAELLGLIMEGYKNKIAVAGMHGKTTTTGLVASAFAPLSPAVHIGGEMAGAAAANEKTGAHDGADPVETPFPLPSGEEQGGGFFITEACEYCRNFLHLSPDVLIVLNIDEDHLDYFQDLPDIICAFNELAAKIPPHGRLIINGDDENCRILKCDNKILFGLGEGNDYRATDISSERGRYSFSVRGERINLGIFGCHQIYNALAAFAAADFYGVPHAEIKRGIESFAGIKRRFELCAKKLSGADVIIDYAHHPKEIRALLASAREAGYEKLHCVFQPHTYTRTEALLGEFSACFDGADSLILMPVYAAREKPGKVDSSTLLEEINRRGAVSATLADGENVIEILKSRANKNDAVLIVGAGNIVDICKLI